MPVFDDGLPFFKTRRFLIMVPTEQETAFSNATIIYIIATTWH